MATSSSSLSSSDHTRMRMDPKLYHAAINGEIEVFKSRQSLQLELLLTPERNTVLHIHIITSKMMQMMQPNAREGWTTMRYVKSLINKREKLLLPQLVLDPRTIPFIEGILNMCPALLTQTNVRGETPLLMAARYGHYHIVESLIKCAKVLLPRQVYDLEVDISVVQNMIRMKNEEEDTALHEAARFGHLELVRILTREDPDFSYRPNKGGETPLYIAIENRYTYLALEILATCSSPAVGGPMGRTALHAAITFQNIGVIKILLEKFGYLTKQPDDAGCVPLHYVMLLPPPFCHTMALEILKMLLEKDESSAFIKNKRGMTPLHIAPFNNFIGDKIMNEILLRCPDSYEEVDNEGKNVLHHAVIGGHFDNVQFILKHCHYLLNRKDNDGNTPLLHMGATLLSPSWDVCIVEALLSHPRVNKMSLNKDNKNIFDVHLHDYNLTEERIFRFFDKYSIKPYIGKRILDVELNFKNFKKEMKEIVWERIEKLKESSLVTSTLITTVTFAAGFTMPGGYISGEEANQQQGTAILRNNTAFQAFVVTDTIAMVLSASSVFINILFNTLFWRKGSFDDVKSRYFGICMKLTMAAMAFMMIAFVTGTYAVLSLSFPLAITTCLIGLSFFLIIIFTTRKLIHL